MKKIIIPRKNTQRKEYIMSDQGILEIGGLYKHLKGPIYRIVNIALDEFERTVVIYESCLTGKTHTRVFEDFFDNINSDIKRFTKISK